MKFTSIQSSWWKFVEERVYATTEPPPRVRTKPLQVICVGPPRSATESLQAGLQQLGYEDVYHGWDVLYEEPSRSQAWVKLCKRKWLGEGKGLPISAEDFDEVLGHADCLVDAPGSVFAAELIKAYPEAKVIINARRDMDGWMRSMEETVIAANESWAFFIFSWFDTRLFWAWNCWERYLWPGLFRNFDSREGFGPAVRSRGKWVYEEHCNMVRGMVPKERLLEWTVTDGWAPLCDFLDKPVPDGKFPHVNSKGGEWKRREDEIMAVLVAPAVRNFSLFVAAIVGAGGALTYWYWK